MTTRHEENKTALSNNTKVLQQAQRVQSKTRESIRRIQQQAAETESLGGETLLELHSQRQQLDTIDKETKKLHAHLEKSNKLQNTMDRWALHWGRSGKRLAKKQAKLQQQNVKISQEQTRNVNTSSAAASSSFKNMSNTKQNDVLLTMNDNDADSPQPALSHEDQQALDCIEHDDAEIDAMLDATSDALDRLDQLALEMKQESQAHSQVIDKHDESITKANVKQHVLNGRMKRMLGIKS